MKSVWLVSRSIRARLIIGTGVMLFPLVLMALGSHMAARLMIEALEEVVTTEIAELAPVSELQKLLLQAAMPPNDYLILGNNNERIQFTVLAGRVDDLFLSLDSTKAFGEDKERELLKSAKQKWEQAREMGRKLLAMPDPVGNPSGGVRMKEFDAQIARATEILNQLYRVVLNETEVLREHALQVKSRQNAFMIIIFSTALGIAALAGIILSRSIIQPIRALQNGIFRFSQGDHSFRVALNRQDEFGQLAQTLNVMAERLELDTLTGVYNRHEFNRKLKAETERSLRYKHRFALLIVDIDYFKRVNDTYGHQCGDDALRGITTRLAKDLRSTDSISRYGGEEFTVILPETDEHIAMRVAERLRQSVAGQPISTTSGVLLNLTVSIGAAICPDDSRLEDELVSAADQALYAAKLSGRNRVCKFSSLPSNAS